MANLSKSIADGCGFKAVTVCVSVLSLVELANLRLLFAGGPRDFCPLFVCMINLNIESKIKIFDIYFSFQTKRNSLKHLETFHSQFMTYLNWSVCQYADTQIKYPRYNQL